MAGPTVEFWQERFATQQTGWDRGGPSPYVCVGPADYLSHEGERPMAIPWRLRHPMATEVLCRAAMTA